MPSRLTLPPLGSQRFEKEPPWLNWVTSGRQRSRTLPHGTHVIVRSGAANLTVVVSTASEARRFIAKRAKRGAYFISNVIFLDDETPRLGELSVRFTEDGYAVNTTLYESDGHYQIVRLDGGTFDVKRRTER